MEKKKKILIWWIVVSSIILWIVVFRTIWSGNSNEENFIKSQTGVVLNENGKRDFFIETLRSKKFKKESFLEKTAKVISWEDITLQAQASGKIKKIHVKQWVKVANGQKIVSLVDSIGSYGLNLERAKLGVEWAKIDYASQKVNLDKAVSDTKIALEKAQNNLSDTRKLVWQWYAQSELALSNSRTELKNTKSLLDQNIVQSELAVNSSKNVEEDTTLALQIQKVENNIAKASLDVTNLKKANIEQLKSFKNSSISTYNALDNLSWDIIDFSDRILWVTELNKKLNDRFEDYLGIKNSVQLRQTKEKLKKFITFKKEKFDTLDLNTIKFNTITLKEYEKIFLIWDEWYAISKKLLKDLTSVLDNSIISVGSLDQRTIDTYKSQINAYEWQTQATLSAYLSFKSQVKTFLNTYKDREKSADENLKLLQDEITILKKNKTISDADFKTALKNNKINFEKTKLSKQKTLKSLETVVKNNSIVFEKTKISNKKTISDLKIAIKHAQLQYDNAKKLRDVTLRKMDNAIKLSKNTSAGADKEFAKLSLKSSIFWIVTDIYVDAGQDVNIGTPIAKISNLKETEAEIGLSKDELNFVKIWQKVFVNYSGKKVTGKIESISPVADKNLMYKITIKFSQKFKTIWWLVDIQIPVKTQKTLVPLNIVEVTWEGKWQLQTFSWGVLGDYNIDLWKVWWDKIEITSKLDKDIEVITTDLSNYDENKFDLKIKPINNNKK